MKFCSYNFMLNEVPDNNDVNHVANIVLNKVPNSNDATCVSFALGKNEGYIASSLGSRLISVGRQAVRQKFS